MLDFDVQKFTRVCAETAREFEPGEVFYAYLIRAGGEIVRRDVSREAWEGPPEDCIAWWKSSVPDPKSKKLNWAPDDVMLHYFQETENKPEEQDIRYILALLLIRRRLFRLEESQEDESGETLLVSCSRNDTDYTIQVTEVSPDRADAIQALLSQLMVDAGSN